MAEYANPDVVVSTDWVAENLDNPNVRLVEVDVDTEAYAAGHIPGAVGWNWTTQLEAQVQRDIPSHEDWQELLRASGIGNDTKIVLYGDNNNWFATFAYWLARMFGHEDAVIVNGGRKKWELEGRPLVTEVPAVERTDYQAGSLDEGRRALYDDVRQHIQQAGAALVDVRSPAEFTGEIIAPPGLPETAQRAGRIPGATNVPWLSAVNEEDGTFKSADELREVYEGKGMTADRDIVVYCRIGERSSHSWFVLSELLGYDKVRNYDGSWTEWGNIIRAPIAKG
ncbi:MAG: sulfurtransferase [Chloroflexota bacterium]|nr:sulfurtransferase [Chloroflexota bacterium]